MFANLIYLVALLLVSPLVTYRMIRHGRYRRGSRVKLLGLSKTAALSLSGGKPTIWIHAVSVGEVNLTQGVVARLQRLYPDNAILVSTSTDTGYDLAIQHFGVDRVFFCPLDFSWAVRRTIENLKPKLLLLAELELWPNLIRIANHHDCPVMVFNARLSEKSASGYHRFGLLTHRTFARLSWVGCQNEHNAERFRRCGTVASRIAVTGSIKFDDAPTSRETIEVFSRKEWANIDPWHRIWVVGSTQAGEEKMALEIYQSLRHEHQELRLILVPRHPERFDAVAKLVETSGLNARRRSAENANSGQDWSPDTVILVDTIGELRHWWGVSQIATVGGSFTDRGGQNMLEPAGYGSAVSFGPDTRNFKEIAKQLVHNDAAVRVADQVELMQFVRRCLTNIPAAEALGMHAQRLIQSHQGATNTTIEAIAAELAQGDDTRAEQTRQCA